MQYYKSQRRSYTPELSDRGTPSLTNPSYDLNLKHNPVDLNAEQVYYHSEPLYQIEVKLKRDAEELPPTTPNTSGELEPPSPTKPRASKRKRKSGSREGQYSEGTTNIFQFQ